MFHENMAHNRNFGVEMKKVFGVAAKYGNFMHFARRTMLYQKLLILKLRSREKSCLHRPGIEPGAQEWEAWMLPLHQRCFGIENSLILSFYFVKPRKFD